MSKIGTADIKGIMLGSTEIVKAYLGSDVVYQKSSPLPYDAEIEYIQHDESIVGTPVIDTGIVSRAYLLLEITYRTRYASPQNGNLVKVCSENSGWNDGKSFLFYPIGTSNSGSRILPQIGNISNSYSYRPYVVVDRDVTFKQIGDGNQFYYDNILYTSDSPTYKTYNSNSNLIIQFNCGLLVKKVALTYNGVCVFDAIPVRVGNVGYLFDKVSGKLFGNTGTGSFTLGADIKPIEYLESTGTQYINTGYTPVVGDSIYCEFMLDVAASRTYQCLYSAGTGNYQLIFLLGDTPNNDTGAYIKHFATGAASTLSFNPSVNTWYTLTVTSAGVSTIGNFTITSSPAAEIDGNEKNLWLWKRRNNTSPFNGRIRRFYIMNNGVMKLDLIPVRAGNVGYMYDKVSGQLFGNSGTGSFILGADKN